MTAMVLEDRMGRRRTAICWACAATYIGGDRVCMEEMVVFRSTAEAEAAGWKKTSDDGDSKCMVGWICPECARKKQ